MNHALLQAPVTPLRVLSVVAGEVTADAITVQSY